MKLDDLLARIRGYAPEADLTRVMEAYLLAAKEHAPQQRKTGEDYITHPLAVAYILAELEMDLDSIIAGLLHDVVEDTLVSVDEIRRRFGDDVAKLVDGVTKVGKLQFRSAQEATAENFRKMFLATAEDFRVIVIKLADRLHNMRNLDPMPERKRRRIALETQRIYAPIADRLGLQAIKVELEDLCLRHLEPEVYADLERRLAEGAPDRERVIRQVVEELEGRLEQAGMKARVQGRVKHLQSIYRKMQAQKLAFEDVHDLLAFRIIVAETEDCYRALGLVHDLYRPVPGRFKDYIALPKSNGYRSLHTVVITPRGERIEVQIRTEEMHRIAERGVAAHWHYKQRDEKLHPRDVEAMRQVRELWETVREVRDPDEFMATVTSELFQNVVYVFTPRGDVLELPAGATVLDFAYRIHTDLGNHCRGARIDGKFVPISYELQPGDQVEIVTRPDQHPRRDWLKFARTGKAQYRIRRYLREHEKEVGTALGRDLLDNTLRRRGTSLAAVTRSGRLKELLDRRNLKAPEDLYLKVYRGDVAVREVVNELVPAAEPQSERGMSGLARLFRRSARSDAGQVLIIGGERDVDYHLAGCCNPLPGERVGGYITKGRGVTVHRRTCPEFLAMPEDLRIEAHWGPAAGDQRFIARLRIITEDREGVLARVASAIFEENVNISEGNIETGDERGTLDLGVALPDRESLDRLIRRLGRVDGVVSVYRLGA